MIISGICGTRLYIGKNLYRGGKFKSCDGSQNNGCSCYGMGMVFLTHAQSSLIQISRKSWLFLILSGIATGTSWLCYYKVLQIGGASWCADQSGLIANGTAPRFSLCSDGMSWFQSRGKWQGNTYQPSAGTIIFFDWNGDGNPDHVGIVEKCENGRVYTMEGNSGDVVRRRNYAVGSGLILGYELMN